MIKYRHCFNVLKFMSNIFLNYILKLREWVFMSGQENKVIKVPWSCLLKLLDVLDTLSTTLNSGYWVKCLQFILGFRLQVNTNKLTIFWLSNVLKLCYYYLIYDRSINFKNVLSELILFLKLWNREWTRSYYNDLYFRRMIQKSRKRIFLYIS